MPTDWTIFIEFNPGFGSGIVKLKTWVEEISKDDIGIINDSWQPTGVRFINMTEE